MRRHVFRCQRKLHSIHITMLHTLDTGGKHQGSIVHTVMVFISTLCKHKPKKCYSREKINDKLPSSAYHRRESNVPVYK